MPTMCVLRCPGSVHQLGGVDVNLHVVCARLPISAGRTFTVRRPRPVAHSTTWDRPHTLVGEA